MAIAHISDPPLLYFCSIPEDLLLNIFFRLFDDPRDLPRLVCVCSRFRNLIRNVCYKVRCEQTLPVLVRGLISPSSSSSSSSSSEPPGGWASLQKLIVCCPGLWHAGVLLRNWDFGMERGISWLEEEEEEEGEEEEGEEEEGPDLYIQENAGNIHKKSHLREVSNTTGSGAQDNMHVAGSSGKEIHEEEEEEEEDGERSTTSGSGFHQQSCGEEDSFHGLMAMEREHIGRLHVIPCHSHHHHHHHGSDDKEGTAYHHSDASSIKEHAIAIACKVPYHTDSLIVSASNPHRKQAKKNNCESNAYLQISPGDHSHESSRNPPKSENYCQESSWNPPKSEGCHPESDRNLEENGDDLRKGSEDLWKSNEYLRICLGDHNEESSRNPPESEEHHHQESDRNRPESEEFRPERSKSDGNLEQNNGDDLWKGSEDLWKGNKNHRKNYEDLRKRDKRRRLSWECDKRRRLKHCHMASGCGNLSREQGNKLLANRFRADSLYICDWPGCVHTREKRKYKLFRGVFKNFKSSHVWRNLKDMHAKPTNVGCAFCVCESTWDMVTTFCLKRCIEYHDDGEPVVRAYVCENGHVSGAWTDRPMYNL